jgi:hypothetical protein
MRIETFSAICLTLKNQSKVLDDLNSLNVSLVNFVDPYYDLISRCVHDFYGKDAFVQAAAFLNNACNDQTYSIIGYELGKTLSDNGTVSRGVCSVDAGGHLIDINERTKIFKNEEGIIVYEDNDQFFPLISDTIVSMNFLCYPPSFVALCESEFSEFLDAQGMELKSEFFLPSVTKYFVNAKLGNVKVGTTSASWFGVTYKEDAPVVQASISSLVEKGLYPSNLWG